MPWPGSNDDDDEKEVDFYRNPTVLSRLILNQKFSSAIQRLHKHPEEASIWVCTKRRPVISPSTSVASLLSASADAANSSFASISSAHSRPPLQKNKKTRKNKKTIYANYSLRQLPLHIACTNFITQDSHLKQDLEKLVSHLVVTYPESAGMADHAGRLALHEAIWHNANPSTISLLLMASPATLHERDKYGRSPQQLNQKRKGGHRKEVKKLLRKGVQFWEQARKEALERMQQAMEANKNDAGDEHTIQSLHSATPSRAGSYYQHAPQAEATPKGEIEPISWAQLEQRAIRLEQLLAEMYEKNYELGEVAEELTAENRALVQEKEENWTGKDVQLEAQNIGLRKTIGKLAEKKKEVETENQQLKAENARLLALLQEKGIQVPVTESRNMPTPVGEGSVDDDAKSYLEDKNELLRHEVDDLTKKMTLYETRAVNLEMALTSLKKKADMGDEHSAYLELLEAMQSDSNNATQRYLSGKVIELETKLKDIEESTEALVGVSKAENTRLVNENVELIRRASINSLSMDRSLHSQSATRDPAGTGDGANSLDMSISKIPSQAGTDELDELYRMGSALDAEKQCQPPPPPPDETPVSHNKRASKSPKPKYEATGKKVIKEHVGRKPEEQHSLSIASSSKDRVGPRSLSREGSSHTLDSELNSLIGEAERVYGSEIPTDLKDLLRTVSLAKSEASVSVNEQRQSPPNISTNLTRFLERTERIYGDRIPSDVSFALRSTSISAMSSVSSQYPSQRGNMSSSFSNADEGVESLIRETEKSLGRELSPSLSRAFRLASSPDAVEAKDSKINEQNMEDGHAVGRNEPTGLESDPSPPEVSGETKYPRGLPPRPDRKSQQNEMKTIIDKTEEALGTNANPGMFGALRKASVRRLSVDSSDGMDKTTASGDGTVVSIDVELRSLVDEAEELYGKTFPKDLVDLLRTVSAAKSVRSSDELKTSPEDPLEAPTEPAPEALQETTPEELAIEDTNHELRELLSEAEQIYGEPIPSDLVLALHQSSISALSFAADAPSRMNSSRDMEPVGETAGAEMEGIVKEAERLLGRDIAPELLHAFQRASESRRKLSVREDEVREQTHSGIDPKGASSRKHSSALDFVESNPEADNLDELYKRASGLYVSEDTEEETSSTAAEQLFSEAQLDDILKETERVSGMSIPTEMAQSLRKASLRPPTRAHSNLEEELDSLLAEAELVNQDKFPLDLVGLLKKVSLVRTASTSLGRAEVLRSESMKSEDMKELGELVGEAERFYGGPIPSDVVFAMSQTSLASSLSGWQSGRLMDASNLNRKDSTASGDSSSEDNLEELLKEAEHLLGREISPQIVFAFRRASMRLQPTDEQAEKIDEDRHLSGARQAPTTSEDPQTDDLNELYKQASEGFGMKSLDAPPGPPSFAGATPIAHNKTIKPNQKTSPELPSLAEEEMVAVIKETEERYGIRLPREMSTALTSVSSTSESASRENLNLSESSFKFEIDSIIDEAQRLCGTVFPPDLVRKLQEISFSRSVSSFSVPEAKAESLGPAVHSAAAVVSDNKYAYVGDVVESEKHAAQSIVAANNSLPRDARLGHPDDSKPAQLETPIDPQHLDVATGDKGEVSTSEKFVESEGKEALLTSQNPKRLDGTDTKENEAFTRDLETGKERPENENDWSEDNNPDAMEHQPRQVQSKESKDLADVSVETDDVLREAERIHGHALSPNVVATWQNTEADDTQGSLSSPRKVDTTQGSVSSPREATETVSPLARVSPGAQSAVSDLTAYVIEQGQPVTDPDGTEPKPDASEPIIARKGSQVSTLSTVSGETRDIDSVLEEAERMYGKRLSSSVVREWNKAEPKLDSADRDITRKKSTASSASTDSGEKRETDEVLQEAERMYGQRLSSGVVREWNKSDLESEPVDQDIPRMESMVSTSSAESGETRGVDSVLEEAERMYGQRLSSGVVREWNKFGPEAQIASTPGTQPNRADSTASDLSTDNDIDRIIRDAEKMYGGSLPADLVLALRDASFKVNKPATKKPGTRTTQRARSGRQATKLPSISEGLGDGETDSTSEVLRETAWAYSQRETAQSDTIEKPRRSWVEEVDLGKTDDLHDIFTAAAAAMESEVSRGPPTDDLQEIFSAAAAAMESDEEALNDNLDPEELDDLLNDALKRYGGTGL